MCGIIGYVGPRECKPLLLQGLERLEYRGYDSAGIALREDDGLDYVRAVGNLQNLKDAAGPNGSSVHPRPRPHALGDARRRHRGERAPADRLRRLEALDRPERDRRELPRAPRRPARGRPHLHLRDGRGDRRPPDRAPLRGRPRRGRPAHLRRARGPLHLRRHPPRPPRRPRRSAPPDAARRRDRRGRDVPRLERGRLPAARRGSSSSRTTATSSRSRPPAPSSRAPTAPRSSTSRSSSTGTTRAPRRAATRRSCSRRSTSRREAVAETIGDRVRHGTLVLDGPRALRGGAARAAPDRHPRLRHRLPRGRRRPVRDRGVGADPGRAGHRLRVDLPQPGDRREHARDRDLPVGRDARHDRGDEARPREGRPHRRDHEHDGLADHARGRLGALHALRARGRRRRLEDVHRAGVAALPRRAEAGADPRDDAARRDLVHPRQGLRAAAEDRPVPRRRPSDRGDRAALRATSPSSSTSAATSACRSRSRAR